MSGVQVSQVILQFGYSALYFTTNGVVRITSPMAPNFIIKIRFETGVKLGQSLQ
jgi:hypothetical protein